MRVKCIDTLKLQTKRQLEKKEIKPKKRKLTKTVSVGTCKALLVTSLTHVSGGIMSSFLTLPSAKQTQDYFVKSLLSLLNIVFTKRLVLSTTSDGLTGLTTCVTLRTRLPGLPDGDVGNMHFFRWFFLHKGCSPAIYP